MPPYPLAFFDLQLTFARKRAELTAHSYQDMVRRETALYRILGLDWSFDPEDPVWQAYVQGLKQATTDAQWSHQFYLARFDQIPQAEAGPSWGCFAYDYLAKRQGIHVHFGNHDPSGFGPLSQQRRAVRLAELKAMFLHIKEHFPEAAAVYGSSWLYNRDAYKRLFPSEYGQSAQVDTPHLVARALWGQFLRYNGQISEETSALFLERVHHLQAADDIAHCFPYQVLLTEAPIGLFYDYYNIARPEDPLQRAEAVPGAL